MPRSGTPVPRSLLSFSPPLRSFVRHGSPSSDVGGLPDLLGTSCRCPPCFNDGAHSGLSGASCRRHHRYADGTTTATTPVASSACLPLPSVNGAAATFLAFRKADPAVRGRLQLLRPSTTKTRASSDLSLATPTPTTPPVAAAEDDGLHGAPFVGPDLGAAPDAAVRTPQPPLAVSWASSPTTPAALKVTASSPH